MEYNLSTGWTIVLGIVFVWELAWKGVALWTAARNRHPGWFTTLLIINTVGILPIIYLGRQLLTDKEEGGHHEAIIPIKG